MSRADDDPWTTESDESWYPTRVDAPPIEVDWAPPEPSGYLWLPDGTYLEVGADKAPFGFARWLHEQQGDMLMGLLDEVRAQTRYGGGNCGVGAALAAMDQKERGEWETVFAAPDASHAAIARVAAEHGIPMTKSSIQRHRLGECKCR